MTEILHAWKKMQFSGVLLLLVEDNGHFSMQLRGDEGRRA